MSKQRYVIIRGQVFRWEEKAPFVPSGESVLGAVEYDLETKRCKCHHCGEWFERLDIHTSRAAEHPTAREYKYQHGLRASKPIGLKISRPNARLTPGMRPGRVSPEVQRRAVDARLSRRYRSYEETNERGVCHAQVVTLLQGLSAELGRTPKEEEAGGKILCACVRRYGSFNKALLAAGLEPNRVQRSKEMLIEILRDFYVLNGRLPWRTEWGTGRLPRPKVFYTHFGSLHDAYAEAGLALVARQRSRAVLMGSNAAD